MDNYLIHFKKIPKFPWKVCGQGISLSRALKQQFFFLAVLCLYFIEINKDKLYTHYNLEKNVQF